MKNLLENLITNITAVLGFGLRESIYQNALAIELRKLKHKVDLEVNKSVMYYDHEVGNVRLDMLIDDSIIIEMKSITKLTEKERIQIRNYKRITKLENGYLINVGLKSFEIEVI